MTCLDFKYGWRWLLPINGLATFRLFGFDFAEERFWEHALAKMQLTRAEGSGSADLLLVETDHWSPQQEPSAKQIQCARVVFVTARRRQAAYWHRVLREEFAAVVEFALLPTDNPRVVVPLSSCRYTLKGLGLHSPGRWVARLSLSVIRVLAMLGNVSLLRGRVLLAATRDLRPVAIGAVQGELSGSSTLGLDYALYLGTPNDKRKTVVLPLSFPECRTLLKVGSTAQAMELLSKEAKVLAALQKEPFASSVPRLENVVVSRDSMALHEEYRPRCYVSRRRMESAVVDFLGALGAVGRHRIRLTTVLDRFCLHRTEDIPPVHAAACRALLGRLELLAEAGTEIWLARAHGDFAPWNSSWTEQGLLVFDWEASRDDELALADAFYYVIAPKILVGCVFRPSAIVADALHMADRVAAAARIGNLNSRVYLAIWLLDRVRQSERYGDLAAALERGWS